jgi:hypothetical protein
MKESEILVMHKLQGNKNNINSSKKSLHKTAKIIPVRQ